MKDFSVRHTNRAPDISPLRPFFVRGVAVSSLAAMILFSLAGLLSAQPLADENEKAAEAAPAAPPVADARQRAQMAIDKPLMTLKEDEEKRRRISLKIRTILREGVLDNETRAVIDEWVEWRLHRMTITEVPPAPPAPKAAPRQPPRGAFDPAGPAGAAGLPFQANEPEPRPPLPPLPYRRQLHDFNKLFLQEISGAARFQTNATAAETFRKYVLDRVIAKSRDLFDNNFYVRLNVVMLLSRLNLVEGNFSGEGAVAYAPVSVPLLEILRDEDQHDAVKIAAVLGLERVLTNGRADRNLKNEIALALMSQLEQKESMFWYPMRLVEALGRVDEPLISRANPGGTVVEQKPFHVQALMVAMRDQNRHWMVRAEAAKSLGRVSLHGSVESRLIAHEIVVLSRQMSVAYNKRPRDSYWQLCFWNVYLSFKPINRIERERLAQVTPSTLITKFDGQKAISDAYGQVLPAVVHVLKQPEVVDNKRVHTPIPAAAIEAITTWIGDNKPSIDRIAPGLPALEASEPMAAKVDDDAQPAAIAGD